MSDQHLHYVYDVGGQKTGHPPALVGKFGKHKDAASAARKVARQTGHAILAYSDRNDVSHFVKTRSGKIEEFKQMALFNPEVDHAQEQVGAH